MASVLEGDKASWSWGGNQPSGTVGEVKAGEVTVTSHRGNEISKTGTKDDPAVRIERSGNDVVKKASELKVEHKGGNSASSGQNETASKESKEDPKQGSKDDPKASEKSANGDSKAQDNEKPDKDTNVNGKAKAGDKRKADEQTAAIENDAPSKEQKSNGNAAATEKKQPGRPKGTNGTKKEKKVPRTGTAARKTRSQGKAD